MGSSNSKGKENLNHQTISSSRDSPFIFGINTVSCRTLEFNVMIYLCNLRIGCCSFFLNEQVEPCLNDLNTLKPDVL